jgi:hypothetical protein
MSKAGQTHTKNNRDLPAWLELVRRQVGSLRYGVVQLVVRDSEVTQIETTERVRFEKSPPASE